MSLSVRLHTTIERFNPLDQLTQSATEFLLEHPTLYKIALLANHIFRAGSMAIFMAALPFSWPVSFAICFAASLFYRLTVENNCAYKFALPALAGAAAFPIAQPALAQLASGEAFKNLALFSRSILFLVPVVAYIAYIVLTVDYDVNRRCLNSTTTS